MRGRRFHLRRRRGRGRRWRGKRTLHQEGYVGWGRGGHQALPAGNKKRGEDTGWEGKGEGTYTRKGRGGRGARGPKGSDNDRQKYRDLKALESREDVADITTLVGAGVSGVSVANTCIRTVASVWR